MLRRSTVHHSLVHVTRRVVRQGGNTSGIYVINIHEGNTILTSVVTGGVSAVRKIAIPIKCVSAECCQSSLRVGRNSPTRLPFSVGKVGIILISSILFAKEATQTTVRTMFSVNEPSYVRLTVLVSENRERLPVEPSCVKGDIPADGGRIVGILVPPCRRRANILLLRG